MSDGPEVTPRVDMSEGELRLIAELTAVPLEKVRGIVWLAEWRMRDQQRPNFGPFWPLPETPTSSGPCPGCTAWCDSIACPQRTQVTSDGTTYSREP